MSVTPIPGAASTIVTGGTAVVAALAGANGGYITNPLNASDQNLGAAEVLYIDPVGNAATLGGYGTIIALQPGQTFNLIPGSTLPVYANAASSGHRFTVVTW